MDPACVPSVKAARAAGLKRVDIYHFPHAVEGALSATQQVQATLQLLQGVEFGTYWLDVERCSEWSDNVTANTRWIREAVAAVEGAGKAAPG